MPHTDRGSSPPRRSGSTGRHSASSNYSMIASPGSRASSSLAFDASDASAIDSYTRYPAFGNGLLLLFKAGPGDRLALPAVQVIDKSKLCFAITKEVEIEGDASKEDPILLKSFLSQPVPLPKIAKKVKIKKRLQSIWMKLRHPRLDPEFAHLPYWFSNRVEMRDPIRDKAWRLVRKAKKLPKRWRQTPYRRPEGPVPAPDLRHRDSSRPPPRRVCPSINPSKPNTATLLLDSSRNPAGTQFNVFLEGKKERQERSRKQYSEMIWRAMSDDILRERGRPQINDPLIGRAPPLSRRVLREIQQAKTPELLAKTPRSKWEKLGFSHEEDEEFHFDDDDEIYREWEEEFFNSASPSITPSVDTETIERRRNGSPHMLGIQLFSDPMASPVEARNLEEWEEIELGIPASPPEIETPTILPQREPQQLGSHRNQENSVQATGATLERIQATSAKLVHRRAWAREGSESTRNLDNSDNENATSAVRPPMLGQQQRTTPARSGESWRPDDTGCMETLSTNKSENSSASSREAGHILPFRLPILVSARQAIAEQRMSPSIANNSQQPSHDTEDLYSADDIAPSMQNGQRNTTLPLRNRGIDQPLRIRLPVADNSPHSLMEQGDRQAGGQTSPQGLVQEPIEEIDESIDVHDVQRQVSDSVSAAGSPHSTQVPALGGVGLAQRQRRLSAHRGPRFPVRPSLPGGSSEDGNGTCTLHRSRRVSSARGRYPVRPQRESSTEGSSSIRATPNVSPTEPPSPMDFGRTRSHDIGGRGLLGGQQVSDSPHESATQLGRMPSVYNRNKDYGPRPPVPGRSSSRQLGVSGQGQEQVEQQRWNRRGSGRPLVLFDGSGNRIEQTVEPEDQADNEAPDDHTSRHQLVVLASNHEESPEETNNKSLCPIDSHARRPPHVPSVLEFLNQHFIVNPLCRVVAKFRVPFPASAATAATRRVPTSPISPEEYNGTIWPTLPNLTLNPHLSPQEPDPALRLNATPLSRSPTPVGSPPHPQPGAGHEADIDILASYPANTGEEYNPAYQLGQVEQPLPGPKRAVSVKFDIMENLQVRPPVEIGSIKAKATEDARQMQAQVIDICTKAGKDPPKYALLELIGKGTFGRVYKGKDMTSAAIVAVKIIDIDESDTLNPRQANTYSEFLKEVNALKILSESKARNINHVIEALPVGQAMWMITEHCGGGSIATLMKPTAPGGLQEKWIIPIAREVAEGLKWVHQADIIHRDIKCANILITEDGGVQLCDFGVAGVVEGSADKRSTIIGTPHWMAPELFTAAPSYGKEVDIWAFGCMVFEMATGLPPNVANGIAYPDLGEHLKKNVPRLEGGKYSDGLRDTVAYCLEEIPSARPTIEQVQRHPYISNTSGRYPVSSLSYLVRAFKMWEDHGGSRKSLFMAGGAQGPSEFAGGVYGDEWNFSTTAVFDQEVSQLSSAQDVYDAYGTSVVGFSEETARPKAPRRRPPPEALSRLPPPLVKIFDPNTLSTYEDNSRNHYGRPTPPPTSDLPLRDDSARITIRDTMIDLGGHDPETGLSSFPDMDTIRAGGRPVDEDDGSSTVHDFSRPALSDPADMNPNRRTQDWKFPSMVPPASADPEVSRFPSTYDTSRPAATPSSSNRPTLTRHPTEPMSGQFGGLLSSGQAPPSRASIAESLIDLDMSMPDPYPEVRPSTANSDAGSATSEQMTSVNPFEFEGRVSYQPPVDTQEPVFYIGDEDTFPSEPATQTPPRDITEISDFSASDVEASDNHMDPNEASNYDASGFSDSEYVSMPRLTRPFDPDAAMPGGQNDRIYTMAHFPPLPDPPSAAALAGTASREEMINEVSRALGSMTAQLEAFRDTYDSPMVVQKRGSSRRR